VRNQWLLILLGVAAGAFILTLPAQAASESAPSTIFCEPPDGRPDRRLCKPVTPGKAPTSTPAPAFSIPPSPSALPFTYAYVMTGPVALYANPADADNGFAPVRMLDVGYVWVRLAGWTAYKWQTWYLTSDGGFLPASRTAIYRPSAFQGITVPRQPAFPFAWVLTSVKTSPQPGAKPDANSVAFKRYNLVNLYEQREVSGQTWYRVGDNQWLVQTVVAKVERTGPPAGVSPGERWIDVSLFEQTVAAYEGDRMVYATLASTGLRRWPTVQGLYRIHTKFTLDGMTGREGQPDYYSLEDVPWVMYFYEDYALHGAYWHDGFGYQHSHGCINLAPLDAKWLYDWTTPAVAQGARVKQATEDDPGTWVWVHD
jgi:hypothetical protein